MLPHKNHKSFHFFTNCKVADFALSLINRRRKKWIVRLSRKEGETVLQTASPAHSQTHKLIFRLLRLKKHTLFGEKKWRINQVLDGSF
jgi:hypothetical protein